MTILEDIKNLLAVDHNGFDAEILIHINTHVATAVDVGVEPLEDIEVVASTEWPEFPYVESTISLLKSFLGLLVGSTFDPSASKTVSDAVRGVINTSQSRLLIRINEYEDTL